MAVSDAASPPTAGALFSGDQAGIITAMQPARPSARPSRLWTTGIVGPIGLALLALPVVLTQRTETRKSKPIACAAGYVALAVLPTTSIDFTASPGVTSPTASVARFSTCLLPIVASVVEACRLHEVAIARIGGLYGP